MSSSTKVHTKKAQPGDRRGRPNQERHRFRPGPPERPPDHEKRLLVNFLSKSKIGKLPETDNEKG